MANPENRDDWHIIQDEHSYRMIAYLLGELIIVEREVVVEDRQLIILGTVLVEQQLGEEGEVLSIPHVLGVACTECDSRPRRQLQEPIISKI